MRDERASKVCEMFSSLKKTSNGSTHAICTYIAETLTNNGMYTTAPGVKEILKRKGVYE